MALRRCLSVGIALAFCGLLALAVRSALAVSQSPQITWQVVGQIGGATTCVAVRGDYAYVGVGLRLEVLDILNPANMSQVGATAPFPHFVEGVAVDAARPYAYVAAAGAGLRVVDISDPAHPTEVGAWDSLGYAEGVAVAGTTVYLADGPYGLRVIDVSDPANPREIGYAYDMNYAFDVAVSGRYAYIAAAGAGLLVADVSDPAHPREIGALDTEGYAQGVAVSGSLACVADEWEGLQLVDVSNPASPTLLSTCRTPGWSFGIVVSGTLAYLADAFAGLQVVDIANPMTPLLLGGYPVDNGHAGNVAVAAGVAFVADRSFGLRAINAANPSNPTQVGLYDMFSNAHAVRVAGKYAYIAAGRNGVRVVDVSDPARARQMGIFPTPGYAECLSTDGRYVYAGETPLGSGGYLYVIDVSVPEHPREVGRSTTVFEGHGMDLRGPIVYASGDGDLMLFDVQDPPHPVFLGRTTGMMGAFGVVVTGTHAYVAGQHEGMRVIDVANPSNLVVVGQYRSEQSFSLDVAVSGATAYLADGGGLRTLDVSDPTNPRGLAFHATPGGAGGVAVSGTLACLTVADAGLRFFDVADPRNPILVSAVDTAGHAAQVTMAGNRVYVADGPGGLLILEPRAGPAFSEDYEPVRASDEQAGRPQSSFGPRSPGRERMADLLMLPVKREAHPALSVPIPPISEPSGGALLTVACTVTSPADSGAGTFRWCLDHVAPGGSITFDSALFTPTHPLTIAVRSALPALTRGNVTVDALNAGVVLDGTRTPEGTSGLVINSPGNTVRGLQIVGFPGDGVHIRGAASDNVIGGSQLSGTGPMGEGNLLSGNGGHGIAIVGAGAVRNAIKGNYVGTTLTGGALPGNTRGIVVCEGAAHNLIGGTAPGEGNVVGGSRGAFGGEVAVIGSATHENAIIGNFVGTTPDGGAALRETPPDGWISGILIDDGAHDNVIGPANVINGETYGVSVLGGQSQRNRIIGNLIGTNISGTAAIGNFGHGVELASGARDNWVGGPTDAERNVISGNGTCGVAIYDGATGNFVVGNYVGTDLQGTSAIGNGSHGVVLSGFGNQLGGRQAAERNIISGNDGTGVAIGGDLRTEMLIIGNYIGTDVGGRTALPNGLSGVWIGSAGNQVGGLEPGERNVISGNGAGGVEFVGTGARDNWIVGNYLGTDANGELNIGNGSTGFTAQMGANRNRIQGNLISGNRRYGMHVSDAGSDYNVMVGNRVGTDASGTRAIPNGLGTYVGYMGASFNRVGGTKAGEGNLISGNETGVSIEGGMTAGNLVLGNWIGTDVSGERALPNRWCGLSLGIGGRVLAGGSTAAERNVISGNGYAVGWPRAVELQGAYHYLAGNYIGTGALGAAPIGNGGAGVYVRFTQGSAVQGNVIAHNSDGGVVVESFSSNTLRRNSIYGHTAGGIQLRGGNESLSAPVITTVTTSVSGTACANCTVEVFSDAEDEGRIYEGSATADAFGAFVFRKPNGLTGPFITATVTDRDGNTSEFSQPVRLWRYRLWLPVFWKR